MPAVANWANYVKFEFLLRTDGFENVDYATKNRRIIAEN
jgi:hypothetical protein